MDQGRNFEVEDLRLKIKRAANAKQTEALAANLVEAQDVEAAQQALISVREAKFDKLEVAELLVGRTSLKQWRKMTKMVRVEKSWRLSAVKEENAEEDQKTRSCHR